MLDSFDHVTIAVADLDAAIADYERVLGAAPAWRGAHPGLGTHAALFSLSNALIELVSPAAEAPEAEGLRALLDARGAGLLTLAFGTSDAAACSQQLRARGVRATAPEAGSARDASGVERTFRSLELSPRVTRGLSVIAVERPDRATLLRAQAASPAAASALDHVVVRTSDPKAALALYAQGLGIRLALDTTLGGTRMLFFRIGGVTLEVVHDASLAEHDAFFGLAYRVQDLDAAHARMRASGVSVSEPRDGKKPGTRVFRVHDALCNVPTLILRDPARDRVTTR